MWLSFLSSFSSRVQSNKLSTKASGSNAKLIQENLSKTHRDKNLNHQENWHYLPEKVYFIHPSHKSPS